MSGSGVSLWACESSYLTSRIHKLSLRLLNDHHFHAMDRTFLIIDGLPLSFTSSQLTALLSQFGPVAQCFIVTDPIGTSIGFGYAELESDEAVDRAISTLTGKNIGGPNELLLDRVLPSAVMAARQEHYYRASA